LPCASARNTKGIWNLAILYLIRWHGYTLNWSVIEADPRGKGALDKLCHGRLHWPPFVQANRVVTTVRNLLFLASRLVCIILFNFADFAVPVLTEGPGPIKGSMQMTSVAKLCPAALSSTSFSQSITKL
jgi:hypothetical protein